MSFFEGNDCGAAVTAAESLWGFAAAHSLLLPMSVIPINLTPAGGNIARGDDDNNGVISQATHSAAHVIVKLLRSFRELKLLSCLIVSSSLTAIAQVTSFELVCAY